LDLIKKFIEINHPKDNIEYPHIIINSIPAPELTLNPGTAQILVPYSYGLRLLEKSGSDIIAIICNTAYVYLDILQGETAVPIINLRTEVEKYLNTLHAKTVTVIGTPYTITTGLYKFNGLHYNEMSKPELKDLSRAISQYNLGIDTKEQEIFTQRLVHKYAKVSDVIILGCSEVALMTKGLAINAVDPMEVLANAVLREYGK